MIMAQEEPILKAQMQFDEMIDLVRRASAIGSGVAEGACRHLVKDRMELTGMRWRTEGGQATLDVRAVYLNDNWDAFQRHLIKQERRRLYPYLRTVQRQWRNAA